jgi:hypothetical protein
MVDGIDDLTKLALSDAMSYIVEGTSTPPPARMAGTVARPSMTGRAGKFPAGFVPTALAILHQRGYTPQIHRHPLPTPLGPLPTPDAPLVDNFPRDDNRDYQFKAVSILEKHGSYIARVATGGGKSRIAALCITRIGRKTAFITTRQVLLYQMGEALGEGRLQGQLLWRRHLGHIRRCCPGDGSDARRSHRASSSEPDDARERHPSRTLASREAALEAKDFLDTVEFVIAEEAHEAGGNSYFEVCKAMRKAHYRLALTATPLMRDGEATPAWSGCLARSAWRSARRC